MSMRIGVHAVYYDERKSALVRDCLLDAADHAARHDGIDGVYLQRHWKHGPQIRLSLRGATAAAVEAAAADARVAIEEYLAARPSTHAIDAAAYAHLSQALGNRELVSPPYDPLWPDNTVQIATYDTQLALLGSDEALRFKEDFLARARRPIRALLDATGDAHHARLTGVARVLVLLASTYPDGGLLRGHMSLRSHVEDYLFEYDQSGAARAAFERQLQAASGAMQQIIRHVITHVDNVRYTGGDAVLAAWSELFEYGWETALALAGRGVLTEDPIRNGNVAEGFDRKTRERWNPTPDRRWSEFHTALKQLNYMPQRVGVVPFSAYRWLMNLTYLTLPLMDVSPVERYGLSYVIAGATEREFDTDWRQILARVRERHPA